MRRIASGRSEAAQCRRFIIEFTQHGVQVSDREERVDFWTNVQQFQTAAATGGSGVCADDFPERGRVEIGCLLEVEHNLDAALMD